MDERLRNAGAILFDVGNVLLTFEPEKVAGLIPEAYRKRLYDAMFLSRQWARFDLGAQSNEEIARDIAAEAGLPGTEEYVLYALLHFPETMQPLPLYHLIEPLRALGKPVYALTNYAEPPFTRTCLRFPALRSLDGVAVSSREKMVKPDPRFFRLMIDRFHLIPENTLFIDDAEENVLSAARLGFQTWHYAGNDRL